MAKQSHRFDVIRRLTGLSVAEIGRLRHLFWRIMPDQIPEVFQRAANIRGRWIDANRWPSGNDREAEAACFLLALKAMGDEGKGRINRKSKGDRKERLEALAKAGEWRQKQSKKRKPRTDAKRQAIRVRLPFIMQKREAGLSWNQIAEHLATNTPLQVSGAYLNRCVDELNREKSETPSD